MRKEFKVWSSMSLVLAGILVGNAVQALEGTAPFAWWHWGTLFMCLMLARLEYSRWERLAMVARLRMTWKKAARSFLCIVRAVGCLPALFAKQYNTFRTEP